MTSGTERGGARPSWLLWILAGLAAVAVGLVTDPKWVLGPLLGVAVYRLGMGALRSLAAGGATDQQPAEPTTDRPQRVTYWCEQCGAQLLVVVAGAETPPRHCGERMHRRVELVREDGQTAGPVDR